MIDPHAKVSSVEQDEWCQLAELLRDHLFRLLMAPHRPGDRPLTPEEVCRCLQLAIEIKAFHTGALAFDAELAGLKERLADIHQCHAKG